MVVLVLNDQLPKQEPDQNMRDRRDGAKQSFRVEGDALALRCPVFIHMIRSP